ncbi:hypothetical protein HK096_006072, partial [Nowakowskiella sp. JEL0078]
MQNKPQLPSLREVLESKITLQNQLPPLYSSPMFDASFQSSTILSTPQRKEHFFQTSMLLSPQEAKQTGSLLADSSVPRKVAIPTSSLHSNTPPLTPGPSPVFSKTCDLHTIQKIVEEIFTIKQLQPLSINELLDEMIQNHLITDECTERALSFIRQHLSSDPKFTRFSDRNKKYSGKH